MQTKTRIVELIGPPGVGKSKLYEEMARKYYKEKDWISMEHLLAPKSPGLNFPVRWLEHQYRKLFDKNRIKSIPTEYGLRFIKENEKFAEFCWNHISTSQMHNSPDKRYRAAYFLFTEFCRYQAILEKKHSRPCLIEEGFLQKSYLIHQEKQLMEELLDEYIKLIPLPHAVIGIDTQEKGLILSRLKTRKKTIPSHTGKDDSLLLSDIELWQHLVQTAIDKLKRSGVFVFNIDGSLPLAEKAASTHAFLKSLSHTS
jgi:hypothetical protein